jgi:hypothetical protein
MYSKKAKQSTWTFSFSVFSISMLVFTRAGLRGRSTFLSPHLFQYRKKNLLKLCNTHAFSVASFPRGGSVEINEEEKDPISDNKERYITYITDIEGDRDYLMRYVQNSRVLCFRRISASQEDSKSWPYDHFLDFADAAEENILVMGGDVCDQGGHDLYVIRQLLSIKQRYPDRVFLVLGNRDINKMRIYSELGSSDQDMRNHPGVHWLRGSQKLGDPDRPNNELQDAVERLKWMLRDTMGSPRAFEYRRLELEEERKQPISEYDVVKSYRESCHPDGEMGLYLRSGHLAVRLGNALFIHGALPMTEDILARCSDPSHLWKGNLRFAMPWLANDDSEDNFVKCVSDWITALNDFASREITEWGTHQPSHVALWCNAGGYRSALPNERNGANLMQYGMGWLPDRSRNPTIVYASWSINGMPRRFFPDVENKAFFQATQSFFRESGISLICSGHQPQGDIPNVIRVPVAKDKNAWIVCADTSYSGDVMWYNSNRSQPGRRGSLSGRGRRAVSEVLLTQDVDTGDIVRVICHGILSDGTMYETKPLPWRDFDTSESHLGVGCLARRNSHIPSEKDSPHKGRWWTRASFLDGSHLLTTGEAYDVWNYIINE